LPHSAIAITVIVSFCGPLVNATFHWQQSLEGAAVHFTGTVGAISPFSTTTNTQGLATTIFSAGAIPCRALSLPYRDTAQTPWHSLTITGESPPNLPNPLIAGYFERLTTALSLQFLIMVK